MTFFSFVRRAIGERGRRPHPSLALVNGVGAYRDRWCGTGAGNAREKAVQNCLGRESLKIARDAAEVPYDGEQERRLDSSVGEVRQ
jgi:hypothetical protein